MREEVRRFAALLERAGGRVPALEGERMNDTVLQAILSELQAIRRLLEQQAWQITSLANAVSPTHAHYVCPRCGTYVRYGSAHTCGRSTTF